MGIRRRSFPVNAFPACPVADSPRGRKGPSADTISADAGYSGCTARFGAAEASGNRRLPIAGGTQRTCC
jgi:hypothetical protein